MYHFPFFLCGNNTSELKDVFVSLKVSDEECAGFDVIDMIIF